MGTKKGLTINLLKDLLKDNAVPNHDNRKNVPYVLWSAYDRIDVRETDSFYSYFEYSFHPNEWIGDVQSLYLYPFFEENNNLRVHLLNEAQKDVLFYYDNSKRSYLFFSIVTIKVNKLIPTSDFSLMKELVRRVENCLFDLVKEFDVQVEFYRSLGTDDIVLLFLGNKISDIIKSIYLLRSVKIKFKNKNSILFCSTTYSVMGQNCIATNEFAEFKDDDARAQILLTLQEGTRAEDFKNSIPDDFLELIQKTNLNKMNEFVEMRIGEYDIQMLISANNVLLKQYLQNNILVAGSDIYNTYIQSSKTIWYVCDSVLPTIDDANSTISFEQDLITNENNQIDIQNTISNLKEKVIALKTQIEVETSKKSTNDNLLAVYQDIILFINELIKIMCLCSNTEWARFVKRIAGAFSAGVDDYLKTLIKDETIFELEPKNFEYTILELNAILSDLRNALSHIHKSVEHFYNTPHPSIYYSGSAHKVLMTYYNYIDLVLSLGYLKPHSDNTKQSAISFVITFGMTNKVISDIHFKSTNTTMNRLVSFQLPYAALYDFKKYFPALLHEVYHLIAPTDRRYRNGCLLNIWIKIQLVKYIQLYIKQFFGEMPIIPVCLADSFAELLTNVFMQQKGVDVRAIGLQRINNYYLHQINTVGKSVLDLDQPDFIRLLINYFSGKEYTSLVRDCYCLVDKFFSKDDFDEIIISNIQKCDNAVEFLKELPKFKTRIRDITKDSESEKDDTKKADYVKISEQHIDSDIVEEYCAGFKEVPCDLFLIDILKWSLNDYLKYMLTMFNENLIPWSECIEFVVRIGMIIGYYYKIKVRPTIETEAEAAENWLDNQMNKEDISEKDRKKILEVFSKYVKLYEDYNLEILPLLKVEVIGEIVNQIGDENEKKSFVKKVKHIRQIYLQLSSEELSQQFVGISELQKAVEEAPKNSLLQYPFENDFTILNTADRTPEIVTIGDLGKFVSLMSELKNLLVGKDEEIWYRGVCDATFGLYPSLHRQIAEIAKDKKLNLTPYGAQAIMMRQAYCQTKTHYTLMEFNEQPLAARHSFLQHYGIPTNFLDFSTNPLAALYWALNPDNPEDRKKECDAAVYLFSPEKYQQAVNVIQQEYTGLKKGEANYLYTYHSHNCLSEEYILQKMTDEFIAKMNNRAARFQKEVEREPQNKYKKMPLVTIVPQKNDRILAQEGCFVAYNLIHAYDPDNTEKPFDYLFLQSIQDEYIKICQKKSQPILKFLFRIVIPITHQKKLRNELSTVFGYSLSKVYPDVEKLFSNATSVVNRYFNNLKN